MFYSVKKGIWKMAVLKFPGCRFMVPICSCCVSGLFSFNHRIQTLARFKHKIGIFPKWSHCFLLNNGIKVKCVWLVNQLGPDSNWPWKILGTCSTICVSFIFGTPSNSPLVLFHKVRQHRNRPYSQICRILSKLAFWASPNCVHLAHGFPIHIWIYRIKLLNFLQGILDRFSIY